jgi:hypothetical protein
VLGSIPTVTKCAEIIDYSESTCYTKNGTLGVKVWCNHLVSKKRWYACWAHVPKPVGSIPTANTLVPHYLSRASILSID